MSKPQASPHSTGARALALDILAAAARHGESVEELLAATLKRHRGLPRPERGLLLELVQGVKRWEVRLDYVLSRLSDMPLKKLHPMVLQLLRLGVYQILMLDRVPARAVLHEAGNLAKAKGLPKSHVGFVNAVLRRLAAGEVPPLPDPAADPVLALSVLHSHPAWLVAAPEYNGSMTALLKNTIDWVSSPIKGDPEWSNGTRAFAGKVVGLLSASPGALGGLRGLAHLAPVLMNLQCWVAPKQFALAKAFEAFDPNGQLSLESNRTALHGVVDQVIWAARKFQA